MHTSCVMQAPPVMHAFGAWEERSASLITAKLHRLSLMKTYFRGLCFVHWTKVFLSDAFLEERDSHFVRDAGSACDARLRRVGGTQRITYHSEAASLIA